MRPNDDKTIEILTRTMREADFQKQVTDLADIKGYRWVHFRPAQTMKGWRTATSGPLGRGWPDLVLVRRGVLIFAELKRQDEKPTPEQAVVLEYLAANLADETVRVKVAVWRPSDIERLAKDL